MGKNDEELNQKNNEVLKMMEFFQENYSQHESETKLIVQSLSTVSKEINAIRIKEAKSENHEQN